MALIKLGANSGKGKVLQIVRTYEPNQSSSANTTSTSFTATGIQASITPTKSGNLILIDWVCSCLLYTSPSPRDGLLSRMPSSA